MSCSVRRSSDGRRIRWNRRNRRGLRPWISEKWLTVRVHFRATSTGRGSGSWASGTSTPSGTPVTLVEQWATSRRIAPKGKGKGKNGKGLDKGKGKGSGRYQGYGYQGACHYWGKVGHKRAECWKNWKDHQNQIRAEDEQEEEAIEQVECQTCWMVGQVDEVVPLPEAS